MLRVDDSASRNEMLMQFQATNIGLSLLRSSSTDASAFGAADGLAVGTWQSLDEISQLLQRATQCLTFLKSCLRRLIRMDY
jgi:glycerol kinase